jgi:hypothetical protein
MLGAIRAAAVLVCLYALITPARAQQPVDPKNMYERVLAIVPLTGSGTVEDPILPMYAPSPRTTNPTSRVGIIAYSYVPSDDGKFALVEFVARDRAAFKAILADPSVKAFLKGSSQIADVITAFKQVKKNFDITTFGTRVQ